MRFAKTESPRPTERRQTYIVALLAGLEPDDIVTYRYGETMAMARGENALRRYNAQR